MALIWRGCAACSAPPKMRPTRTPAPRRAPRRATFAVPPCQSFTTKSFNERRQHLSPHAHRAWPTPSPLRTHYAPTPHAAADVALVGAARAAAASAKLRRRRRGTRCRHSYCACHSAGVAGIDSTFGVPQGRAPGLVSRSCRRQGSALQGRRQQTPSPRYRTRRRCNAASVAATAAGCAVVVTATTAASALMTMIVSSLLVGLRQLKPGAAAAARRGRRRRRRAASQSCSLPRACCSECSLRRTRSVRAESCACSVLTPRRSHAGATSKRGPPRRLVRRRDVHWRHFMTSLTFTPRLPASSRRATLSACHRRRRHLCQQWWSRALALWRRRVVPALESALAETRAVKAGTST